MTNLSWMLWLSDLAPNIQGAAGIATALCSVGAVITTIIYLVDSSYPEQLPEPARRRILLVARRLWIVVGTATIIAVLMPSKTTIIAIAATESAAMVLKSPDGKEITSEALVAVKQWLRSQIIKNGGKKE